MLLADRVIFLTGGSSGIGRECARAYAREGATVAIAAHWTTRRCGRRSLNWAPPTRGMPCDRLAARPSRSGDRAGSRDVRPIGRHPQQCGHSRPVDAAGGDDRRQWNELFAVNVRSILHTTRYGLDALRESRGCILNTSSIVGEMGQAAHAAYVATKGAINALTQAMALDYAP